MRRRLAGLILAGVTFGGFFSYNLGGFGHVKRNEELAFAYELHLNTVKDLIEYARAHAITTPPGDLEQVVADAAATRPNVRSRHEFNRFEHAQGIVATIARELITTMDGELNPSDEGFSKLIRRFDAEERGLDRIRRRRPFARLPSLSAARRVGGEARDERL